MKKSFLSLLLIFFGGIMFANVDELRKDLLQAEKEIGAWCYIGDFDHSPKFWELYNNAPAIFDNAIKLLEKGELTEKQELLLIFVLANNELSKLSRLLNVIVDLHSIGKISDIVLRQTICPIDWSYRIIYNYKDSSIQRILKHCLSNENLSDEVREMVEDVLSGRYWKNVKRGSKYWKMKI